MFSRLPRMTRRKSSSLSSSPSSSLVSSPLSSSSASASSSLSTGSPSTPGSRCRRLGITEYPTQELGSPPRLTASPSSSSALSIKSLRCHPTFGSSGGSPSAPSLNLQRRITIRAASIHSCTLLRYARDRSARARCARRSSSYHSTVTSGCRAPVTTSARC